VTLAQRIMLSISALVVLVCFGISFGVRRSWENRERERYQAEFQSIADRVRDGFTEEIRRLPTQLGPLCEHSPMVDSTLVGLQSGSLTHDRKYALSQLVPASQKAFGFDELIFFTGSGEILGASTPARIGTTEAALANVSRTDLKATYASDPPRIVAHCVKSIVGKSESRKTNTYRVGMRAERHLNSVLEKLSHGSGLLLSLDSPTTAHSWSASIELDDLPGLSVYAVPAVDQIEEVVSEVNRQVWLWGGLALLLGLSAGYWLARRLTGPLADLADQTRQVVHGDPVPISARGGRELQDFANAFNQTLDNLAQLRRQLANTERIAAQREIARRVAHEIKNPLAPIRAAIETLRRLRARNDPAFDEYFEEATHTVLSEVNRITTIIHEFTEFARLPEPRLQRTELAPLVERVVSLHRATLPHIDGDWRAPERVVVDPEQLIQVLTNLVQNAVDAVQTQKEPHISVTTAATERQWTLTVEDNGPGFTEDAQHQLFVPYFTTKGKGTGLGLAIVHQIATSHQATVEVGASQSLGGARVTLVFPANIRETDAVI
jgi:two-component system, NtrC family, nitrogen regulation sensor histidine kinase NtrY